MEKVNLLRKLFQFGIPTVFMDKISLRSKIDQGGEDSMQGNALHLLAIALAVILLSLQLSYLSNIEHGKIQTHLHGCWWLMDAWDACKGLSTHPTEGFDLLSYFSDKIQHIVPELVSQCQHWNNCIMFKPGSKEVDMSLEVIAQCRHAAKHVHSCPELVTSITNLNQSTPQVSSMRL